MKVWKVSNRNLALNTNVVYIIDSVESTVDSIQQHC